jgi:hypothetical protein
MSGRERRKFLLTLFLIGLGVLIAAVIATSTTLAPLKFDDLALQASAVARVRCLRAESRFRDGEIWTRTEFAVIEQNKGSLSGIVEVEMPGGVVGHLHARVEEVPSFAPGEEVYLFLWTAQSGAYRILGWSQGSFRIRRDPVTGLDMVTQDSAAAPIFDPVSHQFRHSGVRNLPMPVFQLKLRRALQRQ